MGIKPLRWENWIEIDEKYSSFLERKKQLLRNQRSTVLIVQPEAEEFCFELHEKLKTHLQAHAPQIDLGFAAPISGEAALAELSQWVQEDWCLLSPAAPYPLVAGAVCFPSRWSLADKMGKSPELVHAPVPDFQKLLAPTKNFLEKITADRPMWRLNWTIHDSDELFCPGPHSSGKSLSENDVIQNCFLRVERQTLCRLPRTGAIAFSIRTHLNPLSEVIDSAERREMLRGSLFGLPEETAAYRGMAPFLGALKAALSKS